MDDNETLDGTVLDDVHQAAWPARPESVSAARRFVTSVLAGWGLTELTDTAALATSELVGNAVLHARTPFTLTVQYLRDGVLLRINDHSDQLPVASADGLLGAHG